MARIRSLKPEIWQSESVGRLSRDARLLFVGIITQVDDEGRIRASSRGLASLLFPFDTVTGVQIETWISELEREGMFFRYLDNGATYGYLPNFRNHQKIDHPSSSKLPAPPTIPSKAREDSRNVAPDQGSRIKDQGLDQGEERSPARDEMDLMAPMDETEISDTERWRMEKLKPWAKEFICNGCKIGANNWTSWRRIADEWGQSETLSSAKGIPAPDRWPDLTEAALIASRGQVNPGDAINPTRLHRMEL